MILNKNTPKDRIILALDVDTLDEAKQLVNDLRDYVGIFKVGLQLFTAVGPEIVKFIHDEGAQVFFDGKFHDIPNTVEKAATNIVKNGATFFNVHAMGGSKMISAAIKAAKETSKNYNLPKPIVLGVTILTSLGQEMITEELKITKNIHEYVGELAALAKESGLDGVVSSAADVPNIRKYCGEDFVIVCPAIRPLWAALDDQTRVVTPTDALKAGADYLVIGRPITNAKNPKEAAKKVLDEVTEALNNL